MNKKAAYSDLTNDAIIYFILLALFVAGILLFLLSQRNGAAVWSDIYTKEIVKVINLAEPGDEIWLNVHKITEIAQNNEIELNNIFSVDNSKSEICVKASQGRKTCYSYFNDVDVVNEGIELGVPGNILKFKVVGKGGENAKER